MVKRLIDMNLQYGMISTFLNHVYDIKLLVIYLLNIFDRLVLSSGFPAEHTFVLLIQGNISGLQPSSQLFQVLLWEVFNSFSTFCLRYYFSRSFSMQPLHLLSKLCPIMYFHSSSFSQYLPFIRIPFLFLLHYQNFHYGLPPTPTPSLCSTGLVLWLNSESQESRTVSNCVLWCFWCLNIATPVTKAGTVNLLQTGETT